MKNTNNITRHEIGEWLTDEIGHPPTQEEVSQTENALIGFAMTHAQTPPPALRGQILGMINRLNAHEKNRQRLDLHSLPMLQESSNWLDWEEAVTGIEPPDEYENIHLHPLESNEKRDLFVAWVKEMVEEEVHDDILESFLILEGSCECHITDEKGQARIVRMRQGDFITMHVGEVHDIQIVSLKPVKAILQWAKVAA